MSDFRELYPEVIIDHTRRPRNFGAVDPASGRAEGYNPLCGDKVTVTVALDGDRVSDVRFEGNGCSISTASASLMTESIKGKTLAEAGELFERFHSLLTSGSRDSGSRDGADLGKLAVMAGVRDFPMRIKCATLAWHTLQAALDGRNDAVTTE
jgi:nitrogen fixation NifU-like protein